MTVRCGNTKVHDPFLPIHHHHTVAQVRLCFARPAGLISIEEENLQEGLVRLEEAVMASEYAAEQATERYFEEGPHGGYYAGSQEEALDRFLDSLTETVPFDPSMLATDSQGRISAEDYDRLCEADQEQVTLLGIQVY